MKKLLKRIAQMFRSTPPVTVRDYHDADSSEGARQTALRDELTAEIKTRELGNYSIGPF